MTGEASALRGCIMVALRELQKQEAAVLIQGTLNLPILLVAQGHHGAAREWVARASLGSPTKRPECYPYCVLRDGDEHFGAKIAVAIAGRSERVLDYWASQDEVLGYR